MAYLAWNGIVIGNCAEYGEEQVREMIRGFREKNPNNSGLAKRSDESYLREWAVHALCYKWGIAKARAKDAKLQFDMEPLYEFLYGVFGPIALLILRF